MLRLKLLGGFEADLDGRGPVVFQRKKAQALLAYLALHSDEAHPRGKLASLLWGDTGETAARGSLRQALVSVRQAVTTRDGAMITDTDTVRLEREALDVDVWAFERLARGPDVDALAAAADLYRGPLLAGLAGQSPAFEDWLLAERERLHEVALQTLARLLAHRTAAGDADTAIHAALRILALDPLQEAVHRALMRLYARQRRRGAALRQYQACVDVLQRELGAEPEPETRALYLEIVRQRGEAATTSEPLAPFTEAAPPSIGTGDEGPLVSRDPELATLRAVLGDAADARGAFAAVLGEAGIGKTCLVQALAAEARERGFATIAVRCHETEQPFAFAPWIEALRAAGVAGGDVVASLSASSRAALGRLLPELGAESARSGGADNVLGLFEALGSVFAALARRQPLVLVVEDVHWADETSLRALGFVARRLRGERAAVIASARVEELDELPALRALLRQLDREGGFRRVELRALERTGVAALVRGLARLGTAEPALAELSERIWRTSAGNPLIAVESLRAWRDDPGATEGDDVPVAEPIRALVGQRLERLTDSARRLATVAAAIGREFEFPLVQRVSGLPEMEAAEALEELVRKRLVHGVGDAFDLTHDAIRRVVYTALLAPMRQALHGAIARELEQLFDRRLDRVEDQIADHYARSADDAKAVEVLTRLAEREVRQYAIAEAVEALERALTRAARAANGFDTRYVEIALRLADLLYFPGRSSRALAVLADAAPHVERLGAPSLTGRYHMLRGLHASLVGDRVTALAAVERALAEAARAGDDATAGKAHIVMARESYWGDDLHGGVEQARRAIARLRGADDRWWLGISLWNLALASIFLGDLASAEDATARLREAGEFLGDRRLEYYALWTSGWIEVSRGNLPAAMAACERALERATDTAGRLQARATLGYVHLERGDADAAIECFEEVTSAFRDSPGQRSYSTFLSMLGAAYLTAGRLDDAWDAGIRAERTARGHGCSYGLGWATRILGRVAAARGDRRTAHARLDEALGVFTRLDARLDAARTRLALAELAALERDGDAAARHLADARATFASLALPAWIDRADALARGLAM